MPDIASALKAEIARLARKEIKVQTDVLKKSLSISRFEITSLRKRVTDLERSLKQVTRSGKSKRLLAPEEGVADSNGSGLRFRAAGMAANRKRLDLSAADFGLLVGATGQSIYAWETGKAKPRAQHLAAIAALRGIGKREVMAKLEALKAAA